MPLMDLRRIEPDELSKRTARAEAGTQNRFLGKVTEGFIN